MIRRDRLHIKAGDGGRQALGSHANDVVPGCIGDERVAVAHDRQTVWVRFVRDTLLVDRVGITDLVCGDVENGHDGSVGELVEQVHLPEVVGGADRPTGAVLRTDRDIDDGERIGDLKDGSCVRATQHVVQNRAGRAERPLGHDEVLVGVDGQAFRRRQSGQQHLGRAVATVGGGG